MPLKFNLFTGKFDYVQDLSGYVPYTGATTDVNIGTHTYVGHAAKADASDGLLIEAANGTDVAIFGPGNTANSTFYGNISMNTTQKIVNMADPSSAQDAATKNYVDTNFPNVTLAGTPDYITISGQVITRGLIDLTTDVTGVLPDANVANDITLDNITQITNRSHTSLSDIGTNTHAQIDTHIATSNTHVDHTSVTLTAGTGLSGGGTIAASRTFDFAPSELTTVTPVTNDEFVLADVSDSENPKVATLSSMATAINSSLDHGTLTGLGDDDHTQYVLLNGRAAGQLIYGTNAGTEYLRFFSTGRVDLSAKSGQALYLMNNGSEKITINSTQTIVSNSTLYVQSGADFGYNYAAFDNDTDRLSSIRIPSLADAGASVLILDDFDEALFLDKRWTSVTYSTAASSGKHEAPFRASADYIEWATFPGSGSLTITYDFSGAGQVIGANGNGYYQVGILTRFNTCVLSNLQVEIWDGSAFQTVYNGAVTTDQLNNEWLSQRFLSPEPSYNFAKLRLTFTGTPSVGVFRIARISIRHATSRQNNYCVNRSGDTMWGVLGVYSDNTTNQLTVGYNTSNYFTADVTSAGLVTLNAVGASSAFSFSDKVGIGTTTISANLHTLSTTEQLRVGYDASNYYSTTVGSTGAVAFDAVGSGAQFSFSDEVGIGTSTVSAKLHVLDTGEQLRLGYDSLNYFSVTVASNGATTLNATGAGAGFTISDSVNITSSLQCDSIVNDTGLAHGTYTPTLSNTTNVAASTAYLCQYTRVGNVVHVSGRVDIDPTSAGASTVLGMTLPIASNFANAYELGGTAASPSVNQSYAILADTTNDRATIQGFPTSASNLSHYFSFSYLVI